MPSRSCCSVVLALFVQLLAPWPFASNIVLATPPSITGQPQNQSVCDGGSVYNGRANFYCAATGTAPLSYQWRRGTTNLSNGGNIAGATTNNLIIQPAGPADVATDYNCLVTNAEGSMMSNNVSLTVWPTGTGDVNGDGTVNGLDVQAFVNAWLAYAQQGLITAPHCASDMDGNGLLGCEDICVFVQLLLQSSLGCGVAPENDDCPDAILISTGVVYLGSTAYATRDGPHLACGTSCVPVCDEAPDVWYRWVAEFSGPGDFSLCGSHYDTMLALYDGCPAMGGMQLACNDDANIICPLQISSRICGFAVNAGQTYWIRVTGWGAEKGCYSFRVGPGGCP